MSWATAVFLIVAISLSIPLLKIWTNHSQRLHRTRGDDKRDQHLEIEVAQLRDRVETLERIVTDKRYNLEQEIRQLENGSGERAEERDSGSP